MSNGSWRYFLDETELERLIRETLTLYGVSGGTYIVGGDYASDDDNLLCKVIKKVLFVLNKKSIDPPLSRHQIARTIVMLYRVVRQTGQIDFKMIEDALFLASSSPGER